jgi:hypothetical protein
MTEWNATKALAATGLLELIAMRLISEMLRTGGCERTEAEYRVLYRKAGSI